MGGGRVNVAGGSETDATVRTLERDLLGDVTVLNVKVRSMPKSMPKLVVALMAQGLGRRGG